MFDKLSTPEEIFSFKLGSALHMEKDALSMLADLEEHSQRPEIKAMLHEHSDWTRLQIANIEKSFQLLGEDIDDSPSPVTKGLAAEGKATMKKTDTSLVDAVVLSGALESASYGMAVYEILVTNAQARGTADVEALLQQNLDQKGAARERIKSVAQQIAQTGIAYAPAGV